MLRTKLIFCGLWPFLFFAASAAADAATVAEAAAVAATVTAGPEAVADSAAAASALQYLHAGKYYIHVLSII